MSALETKLARRTSKRAEMTHFILRKVAGERGDKVQNRIFCYLFLEGTKKGAARRKEDGSETKNAKRVQRTAQTGKRTPPLTPPQLTEETPPTARGHAKERM